MDFPIELSLEQKFRLEHLKQQVGQLTKEEAQVYLLEVLRQMMVKDNMLKHLIKEA